MQTPSSSRRSTTGARLRLLFWSVSPELAFEYHYFFTRKLCMAFHMQALVVAPGGFGTCDEMFEMMTLKQTGKMQAAMPIVLLGKDYWKRVRHIRVCMGMGMRHGESECCRY